MHRCLLPVLLYPFLICLTLAVQLPAELYSPLIPQKLLTTAQNQTASTYPQYTTRDTGAWLFFPADTWTTGFLPAALYALGARATLCPNASALGAGVADWVELGRTWSTAEVPLETHTTVGHDVGFLSFPFVQEVAINPSNQTAVSAVNNFAQELAARFSPIVGCTKSWDEPDPTDFTVIIDNMMNLEVLFNSEALTGNTTLREIAISHANKTMENHVRPDGSSFHVVEYNATTGAVVWRGTAQGYSNNSTWARGQAWGIYGFANMFNHTGDMNYLETSRRMATYFIDNIPSDGIVPWDFNAPLTPPRPADSSAATIAATALLLLSQQESAVSNATGAQLWIDVATQLLYNTTQLAWRPSWASLLANGTVDNPASPPNNLTGIIYGDYYYILAGNELITMGLANCSGNSTSPSSGSSSPASKSSSPSGSSASSSTMQSSAPSIAVLTGSLLLACLVAASHFGM